jgi:hypothetical protein
MSGGSFVFGFGGRLVALALTVGVVAASAPTLGWAQGTSVEELERRLQQAKDERARRDAAAARARDEAEAERKRREADASRAESERKAQESRMSTLVVQADAPCVLSINGKETAKLSKGITELKVAPGQNLFSCASTEEPVAFEGKVDARSGQNTAIQLDLTSKLAEVRSARAAAERQQVLAAQRAAEEVRERQARAAEAERARRAYEAEREQEARRAAEAKNKADADNVDFEVIDDIRVRHKRTGLVWSRTGRGKTEFAMAEYHCEKLGSGWRLPTAKELKSLITPGISGQRCGGSRDGTCQVAPIVPVYHYVMWTSDTSWTLNLVREYDAMWMTDGTVYSYKRWKEEEGGAICVQR